MDAGKANFIKENSSFGFKGINDNKNPILYEEMPSIQGSPPSIRNKRNISEIPSSLQSNQRTPEIFKSLAKLDESDAGVNSILEREIVF